MTKGKETGQAQTRDEAYVALGRQDKRVGRPARSLRNFSIPREYDSYLLGRGCEHLLVDGLSGAA